jgi:hypothetical protein
MCQPSYAARRPSGNTTFLSGAMAGPGLSITSSTTTAVCRARPDRDEGVQYPICAVGRPSAFIGALPTAWVAEGLLMYLSRFLGRLLVAPVDGVAVTGLAVAGPGQARLVPR